MVLEGASLQVAAVICARQLALGVAVVGSLVCLCHPSILILQNWRAPASLAAVVVLLGADLDALRPRLVGRACFLCTASLVQAFSGLRVSATRSPSFCLLYRFSPGRQRTWRPELCGKMMDGRTDGRMGGRIDERVD